MVSQFPPWKDASCLAMVRDWFFPDHAKQDVFAATASDSRQDTRQRAIDKVDLWKFKAGQVPPALMATASLTEAILHDEARRNSSGTVLSESAMQSIYAMAFARFVNGFVDRDVRSQAAELAKEDSAVESEEEATTSLTTSKGESSMYAHAANIGMPPKFVDLRHQVTHGDIPNEAYLRRMTEQALEWLWERWWIRNASGSPDAAVRELEERRLISREAREARELKVQASEMSSPGPIDTETARREPEPSFARVGTTHRKRKSAAIEE